MKVAIPIFENRVSPRFDCTYRFMIVSIEAGKIINKEKAVLSSINPIQRVNEITNMSIDTLICGAVNELTFRMLVGKGINVIPWIIGNTDEVLNLFLSGGLEPGITFFPDGRRICRRVRFGRGKHGRGPRWQ